MYLGIRMLFAREAEQEGSMEEQQSLRQVYAQGLVVNLLNPKTALFFFAFLPQFVNPASGNVTAQVLMLGGLFVGMATITDGSYALLGYRKK
jgi:threonine/homoserine/homoserine lactone efflux protein